MRLYRINENEFINLDEVVSIGIYNEATAVNNKTVDRSECEEYIKAMMELADFDNT